MPGWIGPGEIVLLAAVLLLLVGPRQLPRLARACGESVRELRGAAREADPRPALHDFEGGGDG